MKKPKSLPVKKNRKLLKVMTIVAVAFAVVIGIFLIGYQYLYHQNLKPVSAQESEDVGFAIEPGSSVQQIGSKLEQQKLIKADWAFKRYVLQHGLADNLKAGTFKLKSSYSTPEIISIIVEGKVAVDLFTIFPAQRLGQIRTSMIEKGGFNATEVDAALKAEQYAGHPALADKPAAASLEGYI